MSDDDFSRELEARREAVDRRKVNGFAQAIKVDAFSIAAAVLGIIVNLITVLAVLWSAHEYITKMEVRIALLEQVVVKLETRVQQDHAIFDRADSQGRDMWMALHEKVLENQAKLREHLNRHP